MAMLKRTRNGKTDTLQVNGGTTTLGRGPECQIIIQDISASRKHCEIIKTDRGFLLRDLASGNGTVVNGQKVSEHMLKDGDTFQIGAEMYSFSSAAPAGATPAAPAAGTKKDATGRITSVTKAPTAAVPATGPATKVTQKIAAEAPAPSRVEGPKGGTQKITSSIPKAEPPKAGTQRIAAEPPKQGTQKITSSIPKAEPPKAGTQRIATPAAKPGEVPKPATGIQKPGGTSRIAKKPPTGRKGPMKVSTARYAKDKSTFSMPTTKKGKIIAACAGLGLLGLIALLAVAYAFREDPKKLKDKFNADIAVWQKLPEETSADFVAKAEKGHIVLEENRAVERYSKGPYHQFEDAVAKYDDQAKREKEANAECDPVWNAWTKDKADPALSSKRLDEYIEKFRVLQKYEDTKWKERIQACFKEAVTRQANKPIWNPVEQWTKKKYEVGGKLKEKKYSDAMNMLQEFLDRPELSEHPDVRSEVEEQMQRVKKAADDAASKLIEEAKRLVGDGKKDDARALIKDALPDYQGVSGVGEKLEKYLQTLK